MSIENFGYKEELKRALTFKDLLIYGMIFMVPIAPFGIFGYVADVADGMVPLAYILGMVAMFFTAMSYAAMSEAFPISGSAYAYTYRGIHPHIGFICGWLLLLDYILIPALLYVISANSLQALFPEIPKWLWIATFLASCTLINIRGVEMTARANIVFLIAQLIVLAIFIGVGLHALYGGTGAGQLTSAPVYNSHLNWSVVAAATSIAVLSFLGFDGISTLAEEVKGDNRKVVGRATIAVLFLMGSIFIVQTWIAADLAKGMHFKSLDTAFYEVAGAAGGRWLYVLTAWATALAWGIANALAAQAAVSRILFSMARDRLLPASKLLSKIHPRFKTPYISTAVVAVVSLAVGLYFLNDADTLSKLVNFGALTGFVLLHISVIWHFVVRQGSTRWIRHVLFPLLGITIIGFVLANQDRETHLMGGAWIAIGLVYLFILVFILKRKAALEV
ncbi:APC family permease [Neisseriaceae bacterium TC5R-5]|nr:APC family permease [Neisseriaceae bacterium TC5R-5]